MALSEIPVQSPFNVLASQFYEYMFMDNLHTYCSWKQLLLQNHVVSISRSYSFTHSWNNTEWRSLFSPCLLVPLIHRLCPFHQNLGFLKYHFSGSRWAIPATPGIPSLDVPPLPLLNTRRNPPKTSPAWLETPSLSWEFLALKKGWTTQLKWDTSIEIPVDSGDMLTSLTRDRVNLCVYTMQLLVNVIPVCYHIMPLW